MSYKLIQCMATDMQTFKKFKWKRFINVYRKMNFIDKGFSSETRDTT